MDKEQGHDPLDRHGLAIAIWLSAGVIAAALFHRGFQTGGVWWLAGGFAAVHAGFALHVVVNAVWNTRFTSREVALSLVVALAAILAFVIATFFDPGFAIAFFLPVVLGLASLVAVVIAYMVIRFGPRSALETFDVIRNNNPRQAARLPHRGGRR